MGAPLIHDAERVRWITLDRPEVLNALTLDDVRMIREAVRTVDASTRGIVVTGAGDRAFSSGMHLDTFHGLTPVSARAMIDQLGDCLAAIRTSPVITVAMINGYCLGAAFEMALACDLRVAHAEVRFGLPEVKLGIPSVVEAALLPHYVGLSKAREMVLSGDLYGISDLPLGLVNRVVAPDELRTATLALVQGLSTATPEVIAAQKALINQTWLNTGLDDGIARSKAVFAGMFENPATVEAITRYTARSQ